MAREVPLQRERAGLPELEAFPAAARRRGGICRSLARGTGAARHRLASGPLIDLRLMTTVAVLAVLLAGCAGRRPSYVVVPRATSRSDEPVTLPLTPEGRQRLAEFLNKGGHPRAADPVPDPQAAEHARILDALAKPESLAVDTTNSAARRFCEAAAALCGSTALFRGKALVRQVVDARETRRPVSAPLAVADGGYWWIFKARDGRLAEVLLVCAVDREAPQ